jgi:DNA-binding NtrC family response regulator
MQSLLTILHGGTVFLIILGPSSVGPGDSIELPKEAYRLASGAPFILVTDRSTETLAIAALKSGVSGYVNYPFSQHEFLEAVKNCLALARERYQLPTAPCLADARPAMIGSSSVMRELRERLTRVGSSDANVLITGETGTGKELAAGLLHCNSGRCHRPLLTINCAAIPDSLFESELFGYERGAFTGAQERKNGKLKAADRGTVFLDEIGDMSAYGQAKMLRLIEEGEMQRLGRDDSVPVDLRIIAATNRELENLVETRQFRGDLFFRLNVARIQIPPLRDRKEDVPELIDYYVRHFNHRFGRSVEGLSDEAQDFFMAYDWPGNVRELKNCLEMIFVESTSSTATVAGLPTETRKRFADLQLASCDERTQIIAALAQTNWNKSKAAGKLHWSRMTLYRKIARYKVASPVTCDAACLPRQTTRSTGS